MSNNLFGYLRSRRSSSVTNNFSLIHESLDAPMVGIKRYNYTLPSGEPRTHSRRHSYNAGEEWDYDYAYKRPRRESTHHSRTLSYPSPSPGVSTSTPNVPPRLHPTSPTSPYADAHFLPFPTSYNDFDSIGHLSREDTTPIANRGRKRSADYLSSRYPSTVRSRSNSTSSRSLSSSLQSALRNPAAPRRQRRSKVSFGLPTRLTYELLAPREAYNLRSRYLGNHLLQNGVNEILATRNGFIFLCTLKIKDFPWHVHVRSGQDGDSDTTPLTVYDVIQGIQASVMKFVSDRDFAPGGPLHGLGESDIPKQVLATYHRRILDHELPADEPMRRIDFLKGNHFFHGIQDITQNGGWKLMLGRDRRY
ncbi:hypothetical protein M422DRAFT_778689 [Sphaerobolus stellatus SS14]|uniref:DUF6699 domain-containing protein n=1 Tax=Sphaerobolus stellatus (strain SS14) TaxID=990650 RepID=A0A0C9USX4_SPHS4|nr:hypothetical protein M422DRAFT_778689 [Sphaerobolus stellatus SS14]